MAPLYPMLQPLPRMTFRGDVVLARDLPPPEKVVWNERNRLMFIDAVKNNLITEAELKAKYGASVEDLAEGKIPPRAPVKPEPKPPRVLVEEELSTPPATGILLAGKVKVDLDKREVRLGGVPAHFTPRELEALSYLVVNKGKRISKRQFQAYMWPGQEYDPANKNSKILIHNLRKRLGSHADQLEIIRAQGLRFKAE